MNTTWTVGLIAVLAAIAGGCAGGAEGATAMIPDGVTLSVPTPAEMTMPVEVPLMPADPPAVAGDAVDSASPTLEARGCAVATAPADHMGAAQFLGTCVVGALAADDPGQHFVFNPEPGVTFVLQIGRAGDATFDLGVASRGPDGAPVCAAFWSGLVTARFASDGSAGPLCAVVRSPGGAAQTFRLALAR
jgi:hypothetical protein